MPPAPSHPAPRWASLTLKAAGVYNLVWGAVMIALPNLMFDLTGTTPPNYPELWQCIGMIVGVYGVGYWIAADDPYRHWQIVVVGFLGKAFGPVGFAAALARGVFPLAFGLVNLTNDLIWLVPFVLILWGAFLHRRPRPPHPAAVHRFVAETRLAAPPTAVFAFHQSVDAVKRLTPSSSPLKVAEAAPHLEPGARTTFTGWALGLPLRWVAEHTEYDPPHRFADVQVVGPFDHWRHTHEFLGDGSGGTVLRDEVEYAIPFGAVGRLLLGGRVRRELEKVFAFRHAETRRAVEATAGR